MPSWIKVNRPNIEVGANFVLFQSAIIDMNEANGFAIQSQGSISFFIDGKAISVQQQHDAKAYQQILQYIQQRTGKELG